MPASWARYSDRVVGAEHLAGALQGVLTQGAGRLGLAQHKPGDDQRARRQQGGHVVRAEYPAAAPLGVLA